MLHFTGDGPSTLTLAVLGVGCLAIYEVSRRMLRNRARWQLEGPKRTTARRRLTARKRSRTA